MTAYFNDLVVGGVCCRVEVEGDQKKLYIMTLGVLAPYRRLGIGEVMYYFGFPLVILLHFTCAGALLLKHVLKCAKEDGNIDFIYL